MKAFLLAAGLGTRLRPLTETLPKCLAPVGGRPLLDYWLELLERHGVVEALVNLHHLPEAVEAYLARQPYAVQVHTFYEPELLGSAGTVVANRAWVGGEEAFCVIYADNLSDVDLSGLWACHRRHRPCLTMALFESPCPEQCGIAELDAQGRIVRFTEKPSQPKSNLANAGVYIVSQPTLQWMVEVRDKQKEEGQAPGAFDFGHDVLPHLVGRMQGFRWSGYHLDIGTWENYERAQRDVAAGRVRVRR